MHYTYIYTHTHVCVLGLTPNLDIYRIFTPTNPGRDHCATHIDGTLGWPLHDIVINNMLWCIKYKRGLGGGGRILPSSRALVFQHCGQCRRAGNERTLDSCTND